MKKVKLGEVSEIYGGYAFKSKDFGVGENLVVKIKDIKPPIIDIENADKVDVTKYAIKKMEKYKIFPDDIVIAMTGATIGKVGRNKSGRILYLNQRVAKINPNIKEDLDFIYYSISNNVFLEYVLNNLDSNSAQGNISHFGIGNFEIHWYDRETRQKIAQILSCLDDKIEVLYQINDNLSELAKTIYDYWFVQFDFPDENGKPYKTSGGKMVYNEVLKREIPEGWEVKKIEDYCDIFTGKKDVNQSIDKGKYKFFSCSPKHRYSNDKLYEGKAILVSGNGSYTGRTIFVNCAFDLYQRTYACVPKDKKNNFIEYLYYSLCHFFVLRVSGGTHGSAIPYIVYNDIAQEYFLYNEKIIQKFMLHILPIQDKLNINIISMEELQSLRDWLLPMLMNGQISVE